MPRRDDIESICLLGSGPIVIGQGCEFDYAGCQALTVLREEGFRTGVINPNPATIMTDPGFADSTWLEPLDLATVSEILRRERPDALIATMGGQTALTLARELHASGVLEELDIELVGADIAAIERAEDRQLFRATVTAAGLSVPAATVVTSIDQVDDLPVPSVVRPAYTLGGHGGGAAWTHAQLREQVATGLAASPIGQVIVEESLHGWDEFELEIMRDWRDNAVVVCSIENIDPMGVHTGDSLTVAPQMTLSDPDYQQLRDAGLRVVRAVGVECGGANVQFARNRESGELRVIEMNPRVSRSSALASKATGYPIAKVAARLAVGYTLDEIANDLTVSTPTSFEPSLDYVVVKAPRLAFDAFPEAEPTLGTRMQAVGEAMGIGRTFGEAWQKVMRSREGGTATGVAWHDGAAPPAGVHPWFVEQIARALDDEGADAPDERADAPVAFRCVDSCAGEFATQSGIYYSTRGEADDARPEPGRSVLVVGAGPNRIGQGIEFDQCCVQAARAIRDLGYEPVMVNCNPATVSTDADVSQRLYLEPLDAQSLLAICEHEQPLGVCLQFGGQTPLALASALEQAGIPLLGMSADLVDLAEDRQRFATLVGELGLRCAEWGLAWDVPQALEIARAIGYPVILRPSHVLGGRSMQVCHFPDELREHPFLEHGGVLVDRFLAGAVELDVDAICDGTKTWVVGICEHVEPAGVHSGDSHAVLPPHSVDEAAVREATEVAHRLGAALGLVGVFNLQLAVLATGELYVLELNPRASRTLPFVARATGFEPVAAACRLLLGASLDELQAPGDWRPGDWRPGDWRPAHFAAKAPVFSVPVGASQALQLGPRMRSTGEVMGIASTPEAALAAAKDAAAMHCSLNRAARSAATPGMPLQHWLNDSEAGISPGREAASPRPEPALR